MSGSGKRERCAGSVSAGGEPVRIINQESAAPIGTDIRRAKRGLPLLGLLGSGAGGAGSDPLSTAVTALEHRALWGRYGL